ncbi:uncharacterized protein LOC107607191 [Arachis ipaensis]|uniref:uncharacterized protein LOC107607191 n=1 Tax=Arachis ipaensis TaxID=130454 RepID=UPI0007AFB744|nr:uncharacterized protein LOC107607191 [Arachis ipaensis]
MMQDLERQLANREHRQQTPESSYSRSPPRSHSRRTASPRSEPESAREEGRPRRHCDPIINTRRERRRTTDRDREDPPPTPPRSRSRRTASPRSEPESAREEGRARRRRDPIIYTRNERRRTIDRNREDARWEDDEGRTTRTRGPVIMGATPFHRSIIEVRLPKHFDKPTDMRYDGTQDPQEHLTAFEARMNLERVGDEEIQSVAREYINDEEVSQVVAANKRKPAYNQTRQHGIRERQKEHARDGGPSKTSRAFPRVGKFTNYTLLTVPIVEVYQQIAEKEILSKPRPLKDRTGGNKSHYCDYHKGYGHKTQNCFDLKDALEQAIRDGKLAKFSHLIRESRRRDRDHKREDKTRAVKRRKETEDDERGLTIVNVVTARDAPPKSRSAHRKDAKILAVSLSSLRSPKRLPPISFGPEDQWSSRPG